MLSKIEKVLLIEDEVLIAWLLPLELQRAGYDVVEPVTSGPAAMETAANEMPDVAQMDIHLSREMDRVTAGAEISRCFHISVIFTTGDADTARKVRARAITLGRLPGETNLSGRTAGGAWHLVG